MLIDLYLTKQGSMAINKLINLTDDKGYNFLIYATIAESDETIDYLLSLDLAASGSGNEGLNVNHCNKDGATAMHFACGDVSISVYNLRCGVSRSRCRCM
jgi:ankyrin repeat protein